MNNQTRINNHITAIILHTKAGNTEVVAKLKTRLQGLLVKKGTWNVIVTGTHMIIMARQNGMAKMESFAFEFSKKNELIEYFA